MTDELQGVRLRTLRHAAGRTQTQAAGVIGKTQAFVSYVERGKRTMSPPDEAKLCRTLERFAAEHAALVEDFVAVKAIRAVRQLRAGGIR